VFDFRKTTKILCKSIFFNVVQKTTAHFEKKVRTGSMRGVSQRKFHSTWGERVQKKEK
jgi:hypothetical protein